MANSIVVDGKTINNRTELYRAIALLISQRSGKKVTMKGIRAAYTTWQKSSFVRSMSFAEFVIGLHGCVDEEH
jgi:hypothetical protein